MSVDTAWVNTPQYGEKRVLLSHYIGAWTIEELTPIIAWAYTEFDALTHPYQISVIHDFGGQTIPPANLLTTGRELVQRQHPRIGLHVIIGITPLVISLWQVFVRYYIPKTRLRIEFAMNLEHALLIIDEEIKNSGSAANNPSDSPPE